MHILIIEDDRELCDALRSQLISRNHTADCCHTGSEALYHALSGAYDLILLDRMPSYVLSVRTTLMLPLS